MELQIDPDVKAVAEFMQAHLPATKLVPVAREMAVLAPLLWGRYEVEAVNTLTLSPDRAECKPAGATE